MKAEQFNKAHPVGTVFTRLNSKTGYSRFVSTVARANDLKCGCIVEINKEPYFVKVETLQKAD